METKKEPGQLCTLRIAFPVETDDEAIAVKKKIGEILADVLDAQVNFSLVNARAAMTMPARG